VKNYALRPVTILSTMFPTTFKQVLCSCIKLFYFISNEKNNKSGFLSVADFSRFAKKTS
jgi:hypothetical protein